MKVPIGTARELDLRPRHTSCVCHDEKRADHGAGESEKLV